MTKGQEALNQINTILTYDDPINASDLYPRLDVMEKELKALETLKKNIKVKIDYGKNRDVSVALVFYIDSQQKIYVVDEAIREINPEHFEELENLKEVLEND